VEFALLVAERLYGLRFTPAESPSGIPTCATSTARREERSLSRQCLHGPVSARGQAQRRVRRLREERQRLTGARPRPRWSRT
jgi:hypothetical protein